MPASYAFLPLCLKVIACLLCVQVQFCTASYSVSSGLCVTSLDLLSSAQVISFSTSEAEDTGKQNCVAQAESSTTNLIYMYAVMGGNISATCIKHPGCSTQSCADLTTCASGDGKQMSIDSDTSNYYHFYTIWNAAGDTNTDTDLNSASVRITANKMLAAVLTFVSVFVYKV